jgi:hypothetical protein
MRSVSTIFVVSCLLLVLTGPSVAAPKFAQYPEPIYRGPVGRLDLSSPEAFSYRTRLRAASQAPINFAGHFQIATWGCGAGCVTGAIVDAFTGRVTFLPSVSTEGMEAVMDENFNAFEFRNNSRLIVLSGKLTENSARGAHFFAWDGRFLIRVDTVPYTPPPTNQETRNLPETASPKPEINQPQPATPLTTLSSASAIQLPNAPAFQPSPTTPPARTDENTEQSFLRIVEDSRDQYSKGANEMQQGATRPMRAKQLCGLLKSLSFSNWVGKVSVLTSNGDGKGVFGVEVGKDITLKTWNNSFSDVFDKTMIEPGTPLFGSASATHIGQSVKVSGTFFSSTTDCIEESSITLGGSMTGPDFMVRFSKVESAQ